MGLKMVTFSFDDGTVQDRRLVEIFNRRGLKCTFNLNSGLFSTKHIIRHEGIMVCHDEIDESEVRDLYAGHEVACHTLTHPKLDTCTKEERLRQVNEDCAKLQALTGKPVRGMAYPGGDGYNREIIEEFLKETPVRYARNVASHGKFTPPSDFMDWCPTCHQETAGEYVDAFLAAESDTPLLFYIWGHAFEFDKFGSWEKFEAFCDRISGHGDILYLTNAEVMDILTKK